MPVSDRPLIPILLCSLLACAPAVSSADTAPGPLLDKPPQAALSLLGEYIESAAPADRLKANQSSLTRAQAVSLYNTLYVPGNSVTMSWTGSGSPTCAPGTTAAAFQQAIRDRVNFFRQLAGLPVVGMFAGGTAQMLDSQASALMQGSNSWSAVNPHAPPTSWTCYSAGGANAAGKSNLAKGVAGPTAVTLYMDDYGVGNEVVGHRRWLLYPPLANVATGDVSVASGVTAANDLWVLPNGSDGTWGTRPATPDGVAWPPGGFVPYQVLPSTSNRWSFSWPGANMSAATVSITKDGQSVAVLGYDSRDNLGYGDASVVFRPNNVAASGPAVSYASPGAVDQSYVVTVSGMTGGGVPSSVTYTVTVIDPSVSPDASITGTISNGANGVAGVTFCAQPAAGVICTASNASGAYSCTVPSGWSGKLHSPMVGTNFIPAQSFASVTGPVSRNVSATSGVPGCNLDVDNNGLFDPATDGVAILRRIAGFGQSSFAGLAGACAANVTAASIHGAAGASLAGGGYNVTGGSSTLTTTDGVVIVRAMLGLTGSPVISGLGLSLESGATNTSWNNIQTWLNANCRASF